MRNMWKEKDKPFGKTTMQDVAYNEFPDKTNEKKLMFMNIEAPDIKALAVDKLQEAIDQDLLEETEKANIEYNKNITTLDPRYTEDISVEPRFIIVRALIRETAKKDLGDEKVIYLPNETMVPILTQNGMGYLPSQKSPWQFSRQAIVVNSNTEKYKVGEFVQLYMDAVMPLEKHKERDFILPNGYTHYSYQGIDIPRISTHEHFGYFYIDPYRHIQNKIKSNY